MKHLAKKILVVDDEVDLCEIISYDFQNEGFDTFTALNGREALNLIKTHKFDAIISDIKMPFITGLDLLKEVRRSDTHTVMIFITAYSDISDEEALDTGIDGIFHKPFDRRELIDSILNLLKPENLRWSKSNKNSSPQFHISLRLKDFSSALSTHILSLARGGLFLAVKEPRGKVGQVVSFHFSFESEPGSDIVGTGIIRWVRNQAQGELAAGFGIEFIQLENKSMEKVLDEISKSRPKAFIPKN